MAHVGHDDLLERVKLSQSAYNFCSPRPPSPIRQIRVSVSYSAIFFGLGLLFFSGYRCKKSVHIFWSLECFLVFRVRVCFGNSPKVGNRKLFLVLSKFIKSRIFYINLFNNFKYKNSYFFQKFYFIFLYPIF
jgi:hypothetical protein